MIKNIIFDLSEVLISGYAGIQTLIEKKYGILAEEFLERKREKNERFLDLMRGNLIEEQYWEELIEGMSWNITVEDLKDTVREYLNQPVEGTIEIVKALKSKYQLILLTDHVKDWMEYLEEQNEDIKLFDKKIVSYELGSVKPDKETFPSVLDKAQIIAEETLFIDDHEINIQRAKEVGIHGIVFKNAKQLKEDLQEKYAIVIN